MLVHFWISLALTTVWGLLGTCCALMAYFLLNPIVPRDFSLQYLPFFFLSTNCKCSKGVFDGTDSQ